MFSEAPLPRGLHELRPLTFFEAASHALGVWLRKSSKTLAPITPPLSIFSSHSDEIRQNGA